MIENMAFFFLQMSTSALTHQTMHVLPENAASTLEELTNVSAMVVDMEVDASIVSKY